MIIIGPSGIGTPAEKGLELIKKLKLGAVEIAFTHGVYMNVERAKEVGETASKLGITLSIHASYYLNLCSEDKSKIEASKKRILDSCEIGHYLGARYIVFHAAFYGKLSKEETYKNVRERVLEIQEVIKKNKWDVSLCPETTGKGTQFGDVDELVKLSKETGCGICVDFAHVYARNIGKIDYDDVCSKIKDIKNLTGHFTGIEFTEKGERRHIRLDIKRAKELVEYLKKYEISMRIIIESPEPYEDAVEMNKIVKNSF